MFCCYLIKACAFLLRDRKRVDVDGREGEEELEEVEGRKTLIWIYYMRKLTIFNKRENCVMR